MRPRRPRLGQHFLRDERYADRAVEAADLSPEDVVLEIGPGKGVLTRRLVERAGRVVAVELDPDLAQDLPRHVAMETVDLVEGDAAKVEWPPFTACVSNLPYQISSPVIFRLLDTPGWRVAVLMVQKEFADRVIAQPGTKDYSRLTVGVHFGAHATRITRVPRGAFEPPPQVESALVKLTPRAAPPFHVEDEDLFHRVVHAAFTQRRKTVANALRNAGREFGIPRRSVDATEPLPYADERPGTLPPEGFGELANALHATLEKARTTSP